MTEKTASELLDEHIAAMNKKQPAPTSLDDINETLNAILVTLVRILDVSYVSLASRDEAGETAAGMIEDKHTDGEVLSPPIYIKDPE